MDTVFPLNSANADSLVHDAIASAVARDAVPAAVELGAEAGVTVVTLSGEHDLSDSHLLAAALRSGGEGARVLVDLTPCTYMDLAVIGRLITSQKRLHAHGGRLELLIPFDADAMCSIARRTGLATCLVTHTTRAAAIDSLTCDRVERVPAMRRAGFLHRLRHAG
jgi:anti-anti-sigma factor